VESILDWPIPKNIHEVRQFLGLAQYYRRYVVSFAKISSPLSDLLVESDAEIRKKRYRPFNWTPQCQWCFEKLKNSLSSGPVLIQPDETQPYTVETDASEWAIGYVLLQTGPDGKLHPVAYGGKKMTGTELNYPVHEKELLAIKEALRTWAPYLQNNATTTIFTDHQSLPPLGPSFRACSLATSKTFARKRFVETSSTEWFRRRLSWISFWPSRIRNSSWIRHHLS